MYTRVCKKLTCVLHIIMHFKDCTVGVSPCQGLVEYGNTKIIQHALKLKVPASSECWTLYHTLSL